MQADFKMKAEFCGSEKELRDMFIVLDHYRETEERKPYFENVQAQQATDGDTVIEVTTSGDISGNGTLRLTANGPFGIYDELNDVNYFREIAEAAPNAHFYAEITGFTSYCTSGLKCELKDGLLAIQTFSESNDEAFDAWFAEIKKKLPLRKFKKLFKVSGSDFNKDIYDEFISDIDANSPDFFEGLGYDDFVSCVEDYDGETKLEESEYSALIATEISSLELQSLETFEQSFEGGTTREFVYDPVKKKYNNAGRKKK